MSNTKTDKPFTLHTDEIKENNPMSNISTGTKSSNVTAGARDSKAMLEQYMSSRKQVSTGAGRLLFALDATASRQHCWNTACRLQAEMFRHVGKGLSVSLAYFRGEKEFKFTNWVTSGEQLVRPMQKLEVLTGNTQIGKVLDHALDVHGKNPIAAVVYVGDAFEENIDKISGLASELGAQGLPVFMFLEGEPGKTQPPTCLASLNPEAAFRLIADKSGGEFFWFGIDSPHAVKQFSDTLNAVAKLAIGDTTAITAAKHAAISYKK
jgi:hypothetical protein